MSCVDKAVFLYLFVFIAISEAQGRSKEQVPKATVEALYPKGFRISLKDDGYSDVGYRVNINKQFNGLSEGDIKQYLEEPKDGYWVYKNNDVELEVGDTIFYWIHFLKNGDGYTISKLKHTVSGFVKEDGTPVCREISKTTVQGQSNICKNQLIFSEDFDQTSIRELKKWDAIVQFPTEPDYPFNVYIPDNTVSFEEGSFVITPVLTESLRGEGFLHQSLDLDVRCTGKADSTECRQVASGAQILPPVTTAKITTRRSFNFMFGRVEVRAKLPAGSWIMPDGIDLLVDGEQYGTVNPGAGFSEVAKKNNVGHAAHWQRGTVMAPLDQMFHLTLGLRVGGVNDFADDLEGKPWKNSASKAMLDFWKNKDSWHPSWYNSDLRVDYVRVYAL